MGIPIIGSYAGALGYDPQKTANGVVGDQGADRISAQKAQEIIETPKGERPDPSEYLSQEYIEKHLEQFKGGVTKFYANAPSGTAGPPGGTFVMTTEEANRLIRQSNGDIAELERLLGLESGTLGDSPVRIDIYNPTNLRMPSGNELGANSEWIPGGFTSGGIPEAVIDSPTVDEYVVSPIWENGGM